MSISCLKLEKISSVNEGTTRCFLNFEITFNNRTMSKLKYRLIRVQFDFFLKKEELNHWESVFPHKLRKSDFTHFLQVGTSGCNFLATISFTRPRVTPFILTRLHETMRPEYSFSILFIYFHIHLYHCHFSEFYGSSQLLNCFGILIKLHYEWQDHVTKKIRLWFQPPFWKKKLKEN